MARSGFDPFVGVHHSAQTAFTYIADIPLTDDSWAKWGPAALFAANNGNFQFTIFYSWSLIYDTRLLQRALSMTRVTWDVPETHPEFASVCFFNYSIEKDGRAAFSQAPKTAQCVAKSLIAARLPHLVEQSEVSAFLPTAEAQFADLVSQKYGTGLPLSLICSLCARQLGSNKHASVYANAELARSLNPLRQTLARMAVGVAECSIEKE